MSIEDALTVLDPGDLPEETRDALAKHDVFWRSQLAKATSPPSS